MATQVGSDVTLIQDEDLLRRMWQQTEDFGRKKEIRARMYKLREQRLKEFYTTGEVLHDVMRSNSSLDDSSLGQTQRGGTRYHSSSDVSVNKKSSSYSSSASGGYSMTHADSLNDEGFLSLKSKEIRDSESPTRDFHKKQQKNTSMSSQDDNNGGYWRIVQESSSGAYQATGKSVDDGDMIIHSTTKTEQHKAAADSNNTGTTTESKINASEETSRIPRCGNNAITDTVTLVTRQGDDKNVDGSLTKSSGTSASQAESWVSSSSSSTQMNRKQQQSVSSSSTVVSTSGRDITDVRTSSIGDKSNIRTRTSNTLGDNMIRMTSSGGNERTDDSNIDYANIHSKNSNVANSSSTNMRTSTSVVSSSKVSEVKESQTSSNINETSNVAKNRISQRAQTSELATGGTPVDDNRSGRGNDTITTTTKITTVPQSTDNTAISVNINTGRNEISTSGKYEEKTSNVVEQKIMSELQKLDSFLSTQNATETTPSPRGAVDSRDTCSWTIVSSSNEPKNRDTSVNKDSVTEEFVFHSGHTQATKGSVSQDSNEFIIEEKISSVRQRGDEVTKIVDDEIITVKVTSDEGTQKTIPADGAKKGIMKQSSTQDIPIAKDVEKTPDAGNAYITTYQQHYTNKRISVDVSPTHEAFARSLRSSPDRCTPASSTRSSSKASLDRASPDRFNKSPTRSVYRNRTSTDNSLASPTRRSPDKITKRTSPTRGSPEKTSSRASPDKNISKVDRKTPSRESPETRRLSPDKGVSRTSPVRTSPETIVRRPSPSRASPEKSVRRTSPARVSPDKTIRRPSPTRQSPEKPVGKPSLSRSSPDKTTPKSPVRASPERNQCSTSPTRTSPERIHEPRKPSNRGFTPDKTQRTLERRVSSSDKPREANTGFVPTRKTSDTPHINVDSTSGKSPVTKTTVTKEKRKLSTGLSRASIKKRANTPGASPNVSPTRQDETFRKERQSRPRSRGSSSRSATGSESDEEIKKVIKNGHELDTDENNSGIDDYKLTQVTNDDTSSVISLTETNRSYTITDDCRSNVVLTAAILTDSEKKTIEKPALEPKLPSERQESPENKRSPVRKEPQSQRTSTLLKSIETVDDVPTDKTSKDSPISTDKSPTKMPSKDDAKSTDERISSPVMDKPDSQTMDVKDRPHTDDSPTSSPERSSSVRRENSPKTVFHKVPREKSPEYSSEGSLVNEFPRKHMLSPGKQSHIPVKSPDSSPERGNFQPIKCFRTSPELQSERSELIPEQPDVVDKDSFTTVIPTSFKTPTEKKPDSTSPKTTTNVNLPSSPGKTVLELFPRSEREPIKPEKPITSRNESGIPRNLSHEDSPYEGYVPYPQEPDSSLTKPIPREDSKPKEVRPKIDEPNERPRLSHDTLIDDNYEPYNRRPGQQSISPSISPCSSSPERSYEKPLSRTTVEVILKPSTKKDIPVSRSPREETDVNTKPQFKNDKPVRHTPKEKEYPAKQSSFNKPKTPTKDNDSRVSPDRTSPKRSSSTPSRPQNPEHLDSPIGSSTKKSPSRTSSIPRSEPKVCSPTISSKPLGRKPSDKNIPSSTRVDSKPCYPNEQFNKQSKPTSKIPSSTDRLQPSKIGDTYPRRTVGKPSPQPVPEKNRPDKPSARTEPSFSPDRHVPSSQRPTSPERSVPLAKYPTGTKPGRPDHVTTVKSAFTKTTRKIDIGDYSTPRAPKKVSPLENRPIRKVRPENLSKSPVRATTRFTTTTRVALEPKRPGRPAEVVDDRSTDRSSTVSSPETVKTAGDVPEAHGHAPRKRTEVYVPQLSHDSSPSETEDGPVSLSALTNTTQRKITDDIDTTESLLTNTVHIIKHGIYGRKPCDDDYDDFQYESPPEEFTTDELRGKAPIPFSTRRPVDKPQERAPCKHDAPQQGRPSNVPDRKPTGTRHIPNKEARRPNAKSDVVRPRSGVQLLPSRHGVSPAPSSPDHTTRNKPRTVSTAEMKISRTTSDKHIIRKQSPSPIQPKRQSSKPGIVTVEKITTNRASTTRQHKTTMNSKIATTTTRVVKSSTPFGKQQKPREGAIKNKFGTPTKTTRSMPKKPTQKSTHPKGTNDELETSSSSGDDQDVPDDERNEILIICTDEEDEEVYINELEKLRRDEELEYANKVTTLRTREEALLSITRVDNKRLSPTDILHPKSSRESSPEYARRPLTITDDEEGSIPRFADKISEPEDDDVLPRKSSPRGTGSFQKPMVVSESLDEGYTEDEDKPIKPVCYNIPRTVQPLKDGIVPHSDLVTDLDDESENDDVVKSAISVANRVTHFLETAKNVTAPQQPQRPSDESPKSLDSPSSVRKAKALFEHIANAQTSPKTRVPDILDRPSIFEARRAGITVAQMRDKPQFNKPTQPDHIPDDYECRRSEDKDYPLFDKPKDDEPTFKDTFLRRDDESRFKETTVRRDDVSTDRVTHVATHLKRPSTVHPRDGRKPDNTDRPQTSRDTYAPETDSSPERPVDKYKEPKTVKPLNTSTFPRRKAESPERPHDKFRETSPTASHAHPRRNSPERHPSPTSYTSSRREPSSPERSSDRVPQPTRGQSPTTKVSTATFPRRKPSSPERPCDKFGEPTRDTSPTTKVSTGTVSLRKPSAGKPKDVEPKTSSVRRDDSTSPERPTNYDTYTRGKPSTEYHDKYDTFPIRREPKDIRDTPQNVGYKPKYEVTNRAPREPEGKYPKTRPSDNLGDNDKQHKREDYPTRKDLKHESPSKYDTFTRRSPSPGKESRDSPAKKDHPKQEHPHKGSTFIKRGSSPTKEYPNKDSSVRRDSRPQQEYPADDSPVKRTSRPQQEYPDDDSPVKRTTRPQQEYPDDDSPVKRTSRPQQEYPDDDSPVKRTTRPQQEYPADDSPVKRTTRPQQEYPADDSPVKRTTRPQQEYPADDSPVKRTSRPQQEYSDDDSPVNRTTRPQQEYPADDSPVKRTSRPQQEYPADDSPVKRTSRPQQEYPADDSPVKRDSRPKQEYPDRNGTFTRRGPSPTKDYPDKESPVRKDSRPKQEYPDRNGTFTRRGPSPTKDYPGKDSPLIKESRPRQEYPDSNSTFTRRTPSPTKEYPEGNRTYTRKSPDRRGVSRTEDSPERRTSPPRTSQTRKDSIPKDISPSRTAKQPNKKPVMNRYLPAVERSTESSTARSSNKFGVSLRSTTTSSTTASIKRRLSGDVVKPTTTGDEPDTEVIEDIFDLEVLERMLEKATGYEQRRTIRAQIRIVRRLLTESSTTTRVVSSHTLRNSASPQGDLPRKHSPGRDSPTDSSRKHSPSRDSPTDSSRKHIPTRDSSPDSSTKHSQSDTPRDYLLDTPKTSRPSNKRFHDVSQGDVDESFRRTTEIHETAPLDTKPYGRRPNYEESQKRQQPETEDTKPVIRRPAGTEDGRKPSYNIRRDSQPKESQDEDRTTTGRKPIQKYPAGREPEDSRPITRKPSYTRKPTPERETEVETTRPTGRRPLHAPKYPQEPEHEDSKPISKKPSLTQRSTPERQPEYSDRRPAARKPTPRDDERSSEQRSRSPEDGRDELNYTMTTEKVSDWRSVTRKTSKTELLAELKPTTVKSPIKKSSLGEAPREACPTDSITSSYGVGPTDENGRPLFGLKALRRQNTNSQIPQDIVEGSPSTPDQPQRRVDDSPDVRDSSGRPLFGGLRALKAPKDSTEEDMPEPSSAQLRDLVSRHEKHAQSEPTAPRQKPRAKLRDSFLLKSSDAPSEVPTEDKRPIHHQRATSLRAIIQKHEKIAHESEVEHTQRSSDDFINSERNLADTTLTEVTRRPGILKKLRDDNEVVTESSSSVTASVVSSRGIVRSDGTVSVTRDVVTGESRQRNDEEPVSRVTRTQYAYNTPEGKAIEPDNDYNQNDINRKFITEEAKHTSPDRKIQDTTLASNRVTTSSVTSRRSRITTDQDTSTRTTRVDDVTTTKPDDEIGSRRTGPSRNLPDDKKLGGSTPTQFPKKSKTVDDDICHNRTSPSRASPEKSTPESDSKWQSSRSKFSSSSSATTTQSRASPEKVSPSVRRQILQDENEESEVRSYGAKYSSSSKYSVSQRVSRGDIITTEQRKQYSTDEQDSEDCGYSITNDDEGNYVQSRSTTGTSRLSPDRSIPYDNDTSIETYRSEGRYASSVSQHHSSGALIMETVTTPRESSPTPITRLARGGSVRALSQKFQQAADSPVQSMSVEMGVGTPDMEGKSFLSNQTRVTGVQDVLTRMRNADHDIEAGDTLEDSEARALLNKFLGAQVILQGMEPLVKASQSQSAALVSQVERQRVLSSSHQSSKSTTNDRETQLDIENIWDEKLLRKLLEECSDYDGRRKIRARLRVVMAEQKACAGVVAAALADEDSTTLVESDSSSMLQRSVQQGQSESAMTSSSAEVNTVTHTEVTTKTSNFSATAVGKSRVSKAPVGKAMSPFAKFRQLDRQSAQSAPTTFK